MGLDGLDPMESLQTIILLRVVHQLKEKEARDRRRSERKRAGKAGRWLSRMIVGIYWKSTMVLNQIPYNQEEGDSRGISIQLPYL
jgi:hypothetical protein